MATVSASARGLFPRGLARWALIAVGAFTALSAVGGGIGLLTPGSMGMPLSIIEPFTSFLWPALILIVVIGGSQSIAAISELRRWRMAAFWNAVAGFAMVIFIFVELAIMGGYSALHGLYFVTGIAQLALTFALLDVVPGLLRDH